MEFILPYWDVHISLVSFPFLRSPFPVPLFCQIPYPRSYITVPLGRHPAERARADLRARGLVEDRSVLILYIVIRPLPKVRQI